ncbi:MAG: hypothetical protein KGH79_00555 [Patescibacteria group bacterium]|nr:hypothetical protein [Patescibacteria group bacterium]
MPIARIYAQALFEMVEAKPSSTKVFLANLQKALKRRGHQKLLPAILNEYQKLETAAARRALYAKVTPEMERTRILMQLYRKLTA